MASVILTVTISENAEGDNIYNLLNTIKMGLFSSSGPEFMYKITHSEYNSFMNAYSELNNLEQSFLNIRMI